MGTLSAEPDTTVHVVYITKDERDRLRKYAREMQAILMDLKDSYTVPVDVGAYVSLCVRAARSLSCQERDGLLRQHPRNPEQGEPKT